MSAIPAYISIGNLITGGRGLSRDYDERSREDVDEAEACGMIQERKELAYGCELIGDDTHMYSRLQTDKGFGVLRGLNDGININTTEYHALYSTDTMTVRNMRYPYPYNYSLI